MSIADYFKQSGLCLTPSGWIIHYQLWTLAFALWLVLANEMGIEVRWPVLRRNFKNNCKVLLYVLFYLKHNKINIVSDRGYPFSQCFRWGLWMKTMYGAQSCSRAAAGLKCTCSIRKKQPFVVISHCHLWDVYFWASFSLINSTASLLLV